MNTANFKTRDNDRYCGACSGSPVYLFGAWAYGTMGIWHDSVARCRNQGLPIAPQPLHIAGIMLKLGGFWMHGSGLAPHFLHAIDRFRFNHTVVAFFENFSDLRVGI